jgi:NAD(P)-dependent dehydrogenase (short-subunit alcohol dehydrogenase family)
MINISGRATALQFIRDGCTKLVLTDLSQTSLETTITEAKSLNPDVEIESLVGDLSTSPEEFVSKLVQWTIHCFGRLDYAVNCAGISGTMGRIDELGFDNYRRCLEVNLDALWLCEREELKCMMEQDPINGYDNSLLSRGGTFLS